MRVRDLTIGHIGQKVCIQNEAGLEVRATLTSIKADEDGISVFFKELVDHTGKRLRMDLKPDDVVGI